MDEAQAFNHRPRVHEPGPDPEPRLRGDILVWQILTAYTPTWLFEAISTAWGISRLALWEIPKMVIELVILDPLKRRRK